MTKPKTKITSKKPIKKSKLPFKPGKEDVIAEPPEKRVRAPKDQAQKDKAVADHAKEVAAKKKKDGGRKPVALTDKSGNRLSLLNNWMELTDALKDMPEKEAEALITAERKGQCRPNILLRLHGRFNKLRGVREKTEIMQKIG
jgi:hypothetical protein